MILITLRVSFLSEKQEDNRGGRERLRRSRDGTRQGHKENTKHKEKYQVIEVLNIIAIISVCVLPEEFLHESVKALNPAVLGWLDRLGPVRDQGQH